MRELMLDAGCSPLNEGVRFDCLVNSCEDAGLPALPRWYSDVSLPTLPIRGRFDALIRPLEVLDSNGESFALATLRAGSVPSARMIVVLSAELKVLSWNRPTSFRLRAIRASFRQQPQFFSDTFTKELPADL